MAISLPLAVLDRITGAERKAFVMVELHINATIYPIMDLNIIRCGVSDVAFLLGDMWRCIKGCCSMMTVTPVTTVTPVSHASVSNRRQMAWLLDRYKVYCN